MQEIEKIGKQEIVRFQQIVTYPNSTRKINTIIEINVDDDKKDKKWIKSHIDFFLTYPHIFNRLDNIYK